MSKVKVGGAVLFFTAMVLVLAWAFWPSVRFRGDGVSFGEHGRPAASNPKFRGTGQRRKGGDAGNQARRRTLHRIRLVVKETGKPMAETPILLTKTDGSTIEAKTSEEGSFSSPPPGEYSIRPKEWGFRPVIAEIDARTKVILVEGLGRVKLVLKGNRPGEGAAALVPSGYLKKLLGLLESIPEPAVFEEKLLHTGDRLKQAWDARAKPIFPGTRSLEWDDVPPGKRFILVVSHPMIYLVYPPCPKWTGVLFDVVAGGKKWQEFVLPEEGFHPPCPVSRSFRLTPGESKEVQAFFRAWSSLYIYFDSFVGAGELNIKVLKLQSMRKKKIHGWVPIFDTCGKPRSPVEVPRLFPGEYVVQVSCLYPRDHRIVISCSHLIVEEGKKAEVRASRNIGPNSLFVSNTSGKWEKDTLISVHSDGGVTWENFMGEGGFNLPVPMEGTLEVRGIIGKKGEVVVLSPRNDIDTIEFDLTKSNHIVWRDEGSSSRRKR